MFKNILGKITAASVLFILLSCGGGGGGSSSGGGSSTTLDYEDSPFGFHPALVTKPGYTNNGYYDAQNIGVRWNRPSLYTFWFKVQPDINDPTYYWTEYDELYGNIPEGINILANIAVEPGRVDFGYEIPGSFLPVDESRYSLFVTSAVERYDGDGINDMPGLVNPIKNWQVDNEPQVQVKTGYADLQRITYLAIKQACSECKVMIGGATGFPDNFEENFLTYSQILPDLDGQYLDIFDFHWYGTASGDYRKSKDAYNLVRSKLNEYGFGDIPVWITEMGSYSGNPVDMPDTELPYQSETQQAGDYLKRFVYPLSYGVKKIFPAFGLIEGFKHNDGYFDHTGLIYDGTLSNDMGLGVKKLSYYTYKLMTEKLEGSDWGNIDTIQESDNVYVYKFTKDNNPIYVAWWDHFDETGYQEGDTKTFSLEVGFAGDVLITEAVPDAVSGAELNEDDYPGFFEIETKIVSNGQVNITLYENPVFVETVQ